MKKDYESAITALDTCRNKKNTVLYLKDGDLEISVKLTHEYGSIWGLAVKFKSDKGRSYGKMYERTEDYVIDYLAQFEIST